jgi:chitinase
MYGRVVAMKAKNPNLKVMLAVGGWNHGSWGFSTMVSDNRTRQNFVTKAVEFLKKYKFDGLGNRQRKKTFSNLRH